MNNFTSFSDDDKSEKSAKVLINNVEVRETGELILIRITGSHFLWKMVRRMVGVLVEIGRGKLSEADLKIFLITNSKEPAKYTAPPSGLFLEQIIYKGERLREEIMPVLNLM